jgi:hypothetical protein
MDNMSAADVTPQTLFNANNQHLNMTPGALGTVTMNLCDNASTIAQKLIEVPAISAVLLEADMLVGLTVGTSNVFNSHSRLQVVLDESGPRSENGIWFVEVSF